MFRVRVRVEVGMMGLLHRSVKVRVRIRVRVKVRVFLTRGLFGFGTSKSVLF